MDLMTIILVKLVQAKILVTDGKHNFVVRYVNIMVVVIVKIVTQWTYKPRLKYFHKRGFT